jgi:protein ImuA
MPDRVIEAGDEKSVLICFEEGLRHGGLGALSPRSRGSP